MTPTREQACQSTAPRLQSLHPSRHQKFPHVAIGGVFIDCRSGEDQWEVTCCKFPLRLVDDLMRCPLNLPLLLLSLLGNEFSSPSKGEIVRVLIFPPIGLIDLSLLARLTRFISGEGRPIRGELSIIPPLATVAAAATMEAAPDAGIYVMFERTPLVGFINLPCQGQESSYSHRSRIRSRREGGGILTFESFDRPTHLHLPGPIKNLLVRIPP